MEKSTFNQFRELVYASSGITLGEGKEALVSARIQKRMRALNLGRPSDYLHLVESRGGEGEMVEFLDAISTNVTSFYREADHFDTLIRAFLGWHAKGQRRFRLWSAACSSGEEPYTLSIALEEALQGREADWRVLATDLSTRVLKLAQAGLYEEDKVRAVPPGIRPKYFIRQGSMMQVRPELRRRILFRRMNLSKPPFPMAGPLDAVLCRNVMIYFDDRVKAGLIGEIRRLLKPGGYLCVGHSENLHTLSRGFRCVSPSVYVKE